MPELRHIGSTIDQIVRSQRISTVSGGRDWEETALRRSSAISADSGLDHPGTSPHRQAHLLAAPPGARVAVLELDLRIGSKAILSFAAIPPLPDTLILEGTDRKAWIYHDRGEAIGTFKEVLPWHGRGTFEAPGISLYGSEAGAIRVVELLEAGLRWRDGVTPVHRDPEALPVWAWDGGAGA